MKEKKEIYIISGLGVDERVFTNMSFEGFSPVFIKWITPLEKETIKSYAERLASQILTPNPVIIGLSFGGMVAIEISKQMQTDKIILIASTKTKSEIPFYYRLAGFLRIQKIVPINFFKKSNFTNWFFGVENKVEKVLLKNILNEMDPVFLKWAIDKIVYWDNKSIPKNLIHIHGIKDRVLPFFNVKSDIKVNGGHLITINRADELSKILKRIL